MSEMLPNPAGKESIAPQPITPRFGSDADVEKSEPKKLTRTDIIWGVFWGMWLFGISYGIVFWIVYSINR